MEYIAARTVDESIRNIPSKSFSPDELPIQERLTEIETPKKAKITQVIFVFVSISFFRKTGNY